LSERESGIGIHVPVAEPLVGAFRERYDPASSYGVPAHITLLYPFVPPEEFDDALLGELRELLAAVPAFDFALARCARFPGTLYLAPEPAGPFLELTRKLVERWPDYPPYGGAIEEPVPHLTVAHSEKEPVLAAIASVLRQTLPVPARASEVVLMEGINEPDGWTTRANFPLA
jgi:2'-5' RNA ligase